MSAYVDQTGLAYFLGKLKAWARGAFVSTTGDQTVSGAKTFTSTIQGNVTTASALASNFTISLSGDVSGSVQTNGTGTAIIETQVSSTGSAETVPWSGVTGKPSTFTPSSHTHGNVTNDGKLGTASRAVVTDGNKVIAVSSVTATELGYLSGVTSAVQTQINAKANDSNVVHRTGDEDIAGKKFFSYQLYRKSDRIDKTATTSSTEVEDAAILLLDKNSSTFFQIHGKRLDSDGINEIRLRGVNANSKWADLRLQFKDDNTYKVYLSGASGTTSGGFDGNATTATQFSANQAVTLTGDVTGTASSKAGWSIATTVNAITNATIDSLFASGGVTPEPAPVNNPERAVLCADGVWRYFEQIPFPEAR